MNELQLLVKFSFDKDLQELYLNKVWREDQNEQEFQLACIDKIIDIIGILHSIVKKEYKDYDHLFSVEQFWYYEYFGRFLEEQQNGRLATRLVFGPRTKSPDNLTLYALNILDNVKESEIDKVINIHIIIARDGWTE